MHRFALVFIVFFLLAAPVFSQSGYTVKPAALDLEMYTLDDAHTEVDFTVRFAGLSKVKGKFSGITGELFYDPDDITRSSVSVVVPVDKLLTGVEMRDNDVKSDLFFDVAHYPTATFLSDHVELRDGTPWMVGDFTLHGVTKRIEFPFEVLPAQHNIFNSIKRVGFDGELTLNRMDYGVRGRGTRAGEILFIDETVALELEVVGVVWDWAPMWPRDPDGRSSSGPLLEKVYTSDGMPAALKEYDRLVKKGGDLDLRPEVLKVFGVRLMRSGKVADAAQVLEGLVERMPGEWSYWDALGMARLYAGDRDGARQAYEKVLELQPDNVVAKDALRHLR